MIIPVVIGAIFLGRAFDYYSLSTRSYQIFDRDEVKENKLYEQHKTSLSKYQVIESAREAQLFFDFEPDIGLKIMNGNVGIVGGSLLHVRDTSDTVEILMMYQITDGVESFPTTVNRGKGWQDRPQSDVGTHYIKAIEYGGQLVVSVPFKVTNKEDLEEVKELVIRRIGNGGNLNAALFKDLEDLESELVDKAYRRPFQVFSTGAGIYRMPASMEELGQLVEQFPQLVETVNGGKGKPLRLRLGDLHSVQENYTEFRESREVHELLFDIQERYDDIQTALARYRNWESQTTIFTPEQEEQINAFQRHLKIANRAMSLAISELDITGSTSQFDEALKAYDYDGEERFNRYTKELRRLIKDIEGNSLFRAIYSS